MSLRTLLFQPVTKRYYLSATAGSTGTNSTCETSAMKLNSSSCSAKKSWFSSSAIISKPPEISQKKLNWLKHADRYQTQAEINIVTFNMLAPVYKRLSAVDLTTGYRKREAQNAEMWKERAAQTLSFFRDEMFDTADIISLQEFWLDDRYLNIFQHDFKSHQYDLFLLQRTGRKLDAVAILIKKPIFEVLAVENIYLCTLSDRVALLLWLRHRLTNKDILVANTHLSFPHNQLDKLNQIQQMKNLTATMDKFAQDNQLSKVTCMIMGDFNVESNSPVCDHLRSNGYHSCFEVQAPHNTIVAEEAEMIAQHLQRQPRTISPSAEFSVQPTKVDFVSHLNHEAEEVGVDHIFIRPETMSSLYIYPTSTGAEAADEEEEEEEEAGNVEVQEEPQPVEENKENITSSKKRMKSNKDKLFVDSCHVLPANLSCRIWNDKFAISDHRPVGAKVVFAKKKPNN